jgi:hypothetical protein
MKIQKQDAYYGSVLAQIIEHDVATIRNIKSKLGLYEINGNKRILIKYATERTNDNNGAWRFTFSDDDLDELKHCQFSVLVCGNHTNEGTVCLLSTEDLDELLDENAKWIAVDYSDNSQITVTSSQGNLNHKVAHNAFPKNLFVDEKPEDDGWYYGLVLQKIADYPYFTTINKFTTQEGVYKIDDNQILIKYLKAEDENGEWRFEFDAADFENLSPFDWGVVLVLGRHAICLLTWQDLDTVLNIRNNRPKWINVKCVDIRGRPMMKVTGSRGHGTRYTTTVAYDAFPKNLIGSVTRVEEEFAFPAFSVLNFYNNNHRLLFTSTDRKLDLADFFLRIREDDDGIKTVNLGLSTISPLWETWNEDNLSKIEKIIRDDLEYDYDFVEINRKTYKVNSVNPQERYCSSEFEWTLKISDLPFEDDLEIEVAEQNFEEIIIDKFSVNYQRAMSLTRNNIVIDKKLIESYEWNSPKKRKGHINEIKKIVSEKSVYYDQFKLLQKILVEYIPLIENISVKYQEELMVWLFQVFGCLIEIDETINNYELGELNRLTNPMDDVCFEVSDMLQYMLYEHPNFEYTDSIVVGGKLFLALEEKWNKLTSKLEDVSAILQPE